MRTLNLDVLVTRGCVVESRHRVHAAVVDARGCRVAMAREGKLVTHWRSCAKPFQVMPFIESGGFDALGWGDDQLALACASHGGEPEHVALAERMLASVGLEEGDLVCGPHEPLSARGSRLLRESGARLTRLHNNCSGKHAAMLARAQTSGWPTEGYERLDHPVQDAIADTIGEWASLGRDELGRSVDGCGVVEFSLSLDAMAAAYAALASSARRGENVPRRITEAMRENPHLVGGTERFDTMIIEETDGRVLAKIGAEGVHSVAVLDQGLGMAIKVEDGASRAQFPAVLRLLQEFGALSTELSPRLAELAHKPLRNTRGEIVGEIYCA